MDKNNKVESFTYDREGSSKKIKINFLEKDMCCKEYIQLIIEKSKDSKILIILNSVRRSQTLWRRLHEEINKLSLNIETGLLHSRFVQFKRSEIEEKWLEKYGKKEQDENINCIFVGSQVLEQSLDIDSCCLFTDLCPIDIFIQRLGRLWRFNIDRETKFPEVFIFTPGKITARTWRLRVDEFEWRGIIPLVYFDYYILKTYYAIKRRKYITPYKDMRKLLSKVYKRRENEPKWFDNFYKKMEKDKRKEEKAAIQQLCKANGLLDDDDLQMTDNDEEKEIEKKIVMPSTRYIKQATSKFVLLKDVERNVDGSRFVLHFLNGETVVIDKEDFNGNKKNYSKKREIWKKSLNSSVPIALNRFEDDYEIKNKLRDSYKDTIIDKFFGKFLFLLLLDENRNLLDIDRNPVNCYFAYADDLGLFKKQK